MIKGERNADGETPASAPVRPRPSIDPVSKAIIEMLQVDGRRPFAEIAEELHVEESAVQARVEELCERGLIQITAVSDPLQLGFARQAMLGLKVAEGQEKAVAAAVAELPEVVYVVITAGGFDLLCEVVGTSDAHLLETVTRIKPLPGLLEVHTFLYLQLQKQTYTWGVR